MPDHDAFLGHAAPRHLCACGVDDAQVGESFARANIGPSGSNGDAPVGHLLGECACVAEVVLLHPAARRGREDQSDPHELSRTSCVMRWYANAPARSKSPSATNESTR